MDDRILSGIQHWRVIVGKEGLEYLAHSPLRLPSFDGRVVFETDGGVREVVLSDGRLDINVTPTQPRIARVTFAAHDWRPPFGPAINPPARRRAVPGCGAWTGRACARRRPENRPARCRSPA